MYGVYRFSFAGTLRVVAAAASSMALFCCSGVDGVTAPVASGSVDDASDAGATDEPRSDRDASARGRDAGSDDTDGGVPPVDGGKLDAPPPLWGLDSSYLYTVDPVTSTVHRVASYANGGCGYLNDIAIDTAGHLYGASDWTTTDADGGTDLHYTLVRIAIDTGAKTATCTPVDTSIDIQQTSLGFRAKGDMLGVSFLGAATVGSVSPSDGTTHPTSFLLDTANMNGDDVACSTNGTCWAAVGYGGTGPNIVSFSDTLTGATAPAWNPPVFCWGLAYSRNVLYCFASGGQILKLDLSATTQTTTAMPIHMDDASALPSYWSGAASQPTE